MTQSRLFLPDVLWHTLHVHRFLVIAAFRRKDRIDFQHPQNYLSCGQESSVPGKFRLRWLLSMRFASCARFHKRKVPKLKKQMAKLASNRWAWDARAGLLNCLVLNFGIQEAPTRHCPSTGKMQELQERSPSSTPRKRVPLFLHWHRASHYPRSSQGESF